MKISIPFWGSLLLLVSIGAAAEKEDPIIEIVGIGEAAVSNAEKTWSVFGGEEVHFLLSIRSAEKATLEVQSDLFQTSSGNFAAPLQKDILIASELDLIPHTSRELSFPLEFPEVARTSSFVLRYRVRTPGEEKWHSAGFTSIRVYPQNILQPIRAFAERNPVYLYGENEKLSAFLKKNEIYFQDSRDIFPLEDKKPCLVLTEYMDDDWFRIPPNLPQNQAVVLFHPSHEGLPRIVVKRSGRGVLAEVKMNLLDRIMNDPESQATLVEIVNEALRPIDQH